MVNEVGLCSFYILMAIIMVPYLYNLQQDNPDLFYIILLLS